jgi:hypothetical protein
MAQLGLTRYCGTYDNLVFESGVCMPDGSDTAHVGPSRGDTAQLSINGVLIEGDLETIIGSSLGSGLMNLRIAGNLGTAIATSYIINVDVCLDADLIDGGLILYNAEINGDLGTAKAIYTIANVNVGDDLGTMVAGSTITNIHVDDDADEMSAGAVMNIVNVLGNAGNVSAGSLMANVAVAGDMLTLSAGTMYNVGVGGSVGFAVDLYGETILGNGFTQAHAAQLLGLGSVDELMTGGDVGPDGHGYHNGHSHGGGRFYGGLEADRLFKVSVAGPISDVTARVYGYGSDDLVNAALDDAYVQLYPGHVWVKVDGEIIQDPTDLL